MVLLVVNTQKLITNHKLYKFEEFESNVKKLIATARELCGRKDMRDGIL